MRNNFKWTLLFLSLIAIGNILSCSSAQHEKNKSEEQPIAKKESEIIYSGLTESEIQEVDFDGYGIQVNRVEVRPVLGEELKVELDTVILAKSGRSFKDYFLSPTSGTRNLKYVYTDGVISDNRLKPVIDQIVYVDAAECGNEEGVQWQILEDGSGIAVVCNASYIRIDKSGEHDLSKLKYRYWMIWEERKEDYHSINGTEICLTHDGKYLYKVITLSGENDIWVSKYDISQKVLVWTKKIVDKKSSGIWCISPDNKLIFTKGKTLVDKSFDLIKEFEHPGQIRIDRAMPQFFKHQGKQLLMIPTSKAISIIDCTGDSIADEIWFLEIKYIQYCYVHKNQIIMQVLLADDEKKMLTIQLDDLSNIKIRPNEQNLVRGLDNKLVQANEEKYKVYKILE